MRIVPVSDPKAYACIKNPVKAEVARKGNRADHLHYRVPTHECLNDGDQCDQGLWVRLQLFIVYDGHENED